MLKKMFMVVIMLFSAQFSLAQNCFELFKIPETEVTKMFDSLVTQKSSQNLTREAAGRTLERHKAQFTINDYLYIMNYGQGDNFSYSTAWDMLKQLSDVTPLTPAQVSEAIRTINDGEHAATIFWQLGEFKADNNFNTNYKFSGTTSDWIQIVLNKYESLKKSNSNQALIFINTIFSRPSVNSGTIVRLKLTPAQITTLLRSLPQQTLNMEALDVFVKSISATTLGQVDPTLLFSRFNFIDWTNKNLSSWDIRAYSFAQQVILLIQDISFIQKLKDDAFVPNYPDETLVAILMAKSEALSRLTPEQEKEALLHFSRISSLTPSPHAEGIFEMYLSAQQMVIRNLNPQVLNALMDATREIETKILRYEIGFNDTIVQEFLINEVPNFEQLQPEYVKRFFDDYIKVLAKDNTNYNYHPFSQIYIHPHEEITRAVLRAAYDLLKLDQKTGFIGEREIQLYFDLRIGNRVTIKNPNLWQIFTQARLKPMSHKEAIAYIETYLE